MFFFFFLHGLFRESFLEVAALELLASLVPDTLVAAALNGATPAHDAAFQGLRVDPKGFRV